MLLVNFDEPPVKKYDYFITSFIFDTKSNCSTAENGRKLIVGLDVMCGLIFNN
jgi:hypothetical protein